MTSTIDRPVHEVQAPLGADYVAPWQYDLPMPTRQFFGVARGVDGRTIVVGAAGHQWADGSVAPGAAVEIIGSPAGLTAAQARELAAALLESADELDRWQAEAPARVIRGEMNRERLLARRRWPR